MKVLRASTARRLRGAALLLALAATSAQWSCSASRFGRRTVSSPTLDNGVESSRIVQAVGPGRLRVLSFNMGDVRLGQCATPGGGLDQQLCYDGGGSFIDINHNLMPNLNVGTFRQYSQRADTTGSLEVASTVNGIAGGSYGRYLLVFEWRRYRYQELFARRDVNTRNATRVEITPGRALVTAVEVGIAVRIAFDVRLRSMDASVSGSFGFGNLATALANQQADVQVGYEVIGATRDILPRNPVNISSVDGYVSAMSDFYGAVRALSDEWNTYAGATDADGGTRSDAGASAPIFNLGLLAYYVTGPDSTDDDAQQSFSAGYAEGLRHAAAARTCEESLATIQLEPSSVDGGLPQRNVDRVAGVHAAYAMVTDNAECANHRPTAEQRRRANVELQRFSDAR